MKIVLIGNVNSVHIHRWISWFNKINQDLILITDQNTVPGWVKESNKVYQLPNPNGYRIPGYWSYRVFMNSLKVNKIIKNEKPDIVHVHQLSNYLSIHIDFHPLVINAWGSEVYRMVRGGIDEKFIRINLKKADFVLGTTKEMIDTLNREFNVPFEKMDYFMWGLDTKLFRPRENKESLKKELSLPEDKIIFISPRGLSVLYRNNIIVEAFARALKRRDDIFLVILGYNTNEKIKEEVISIIKERGISESVKIIPSKLDPAQLAIYFSTSDFYIGIPSSDQLSSALLESMASGCVPIVSNLKAYEEVIEDKRNGFVMHSDDPEELSEIIIEAAEMNHKLKDWRIKNRKFVEDNYEWDNLASKMIKIYTDLIER